MPELSKTQQEEVKKEVVRQTDKIEKKLHKKLIEKSSEFGSEFKKQLFTGLVAAFGLVIALSWQTVIRGFIAELPKSEFITNHPYITDLYTAIIVTFLGTLGILALSHYLKKPQPITT